MNKLFANILAMAAIFAVVSGQAQEVSPVDFMRMNPYQMKSNPATDLPYESVMSLVVGNIGVNVQHSTFRYNNLFDFDAQGRPDVYNLTKFANSMKSNNFLGVNVNVDLFNLDRRLNKGMLTVDHRIKVDGGVWLNDGPFKLLGYGNSAFVGEDHPVNINVNAHAYACQEFAVGYQTNINEQLSIGGRVKVLFGILNVRTDVAKAKLVTDPDTYALRLEETVDVRASLPRAVTLEDGVLGGNGGFAFVDLFRNPGFGIDFAAEYRFDDRFSAVAAIHDLGFMYWEFNDMKISSAISDAGQFYDHGSFLFNGLSLNQIEMITSNEDQRKLFLDSLQQYFQLEFSPLDHYTTMLNTNILLRGNYDLDANNRLSAQLQGKFYGNGFRPALTLAYSGSFNKMFDVCATYTMMRCSFDNIGIGVAGNFDTFHIYLTTNNVLGFFMPMNTSALNAQVGIVFNLRMEERHTIDESGMPEYLE